MYLMVDGTVLCICDVFVKTFGKTENYVNFGLQNNAKHDATCRPTATIRRIHTQLCGDLDSAAGSTLRCRQLRYGYLRRPATRFHDSLPDHIQLDMAEYSLGRQHPVSVGRFRRAVVGSSCLGVGRRPALSTAVHAAGSRQAAG